MYRVLAGIFALLITNTVFALEAEYKNSLTGIDLHKMSDSSYNIDLFTSKQIHEPVKIVKKSELSYYILLPETKNTIQNTAVSNSDIRSIEMQSFPYAGADVKNGYTKININTTKPIKFNIATKTLTVSNPQGTIAKEAEKTDKIENSEAKVQKKNLSQSSQEQKSNHIANSAPDEPAIKKHAVAMASKVSLPDDTSAKQEIIEPKKPEHAVQKETPKPKQEPEIKEVPPVLETLDDSGISQDSANNEETLSEQEPESPVMQEPEPLSLEDNIEEPQETGIGFIEKFQNKLSEYGLNFKELFLMIFAGIVCIVAFLLFIRRNRDDVETRIKSKMDFSENNANKSTTLVAKKNPPKPKNKEKENNKYFVLDKNVRQTGLIAPTSRELKNYNLSDYKPSIQNKINNRIERYQGKSVTSEYDIIQNILREDNFVDYSNNKTVVREEKQPSNVTPRQSEVLEPIVSKQAQGALKEKEKPQEPVVLSSVEIGTQRGFMCVSYNNSISLIGYIFDDVFALYNFQASELDDYTIKYRVSEKTQHGINYLVRIDKSKLLISTTKSSMNMEIAM